MRKNIDQKNSECGQANQKNPKVIIYSGKLDERKIRDDKLFWKTNRPFLSSKMVSNDKIAIAENVDITSNANEICKTLNSLFGNVTKSLGFKEYNNFRNSPP